MMGQTFEYPNLLSGTRSGEGWIQGGYNAGTGIELYNDGSSECSLYSPPVVLHTGTDYTLSCFAANTGNMKGTKWCVINRATGSLAAYRILDKPGPGGVAHRAYSSLGQCRGRRSVFRTLRQRGDHGRGKMRHMVPRHHAHRGHGAARMGAGRRGGMAVDER